MAASSPFASGASSTGSAAAKSRAVAARVGSRDALRRASRRIHRVSRDSRARGARASLAAAAAAAEADARAGFEDDAARRSAGRVAADHDRWLSRCVVHYDVRVEGLPADVATAPGELAALTPAAPEARGDVTRVGGGVRRGRERGLEKATAKSAKPVVAPWSPDEVRARLIDGVAPKLTKQTVVNAMRRAFDVDALASAGLEGNAATMAKRASAAKLCDAYAALVAAAESGARNERRRTPRDEPERGGRRARRPEPERGGRRARRPEPERGGRRARRPEPERGGRRANPNPNEEDAARGGPNPNEEDAARGGPNPNEEDAARRVPPPPAPNDVPSDSAWGLYWRALACGIGGGAATTAPPRAARERATPTTASQTPSPSSRANTFVVRIARTHVAASHVAASASAAAATALLASLHRHASSSASSSAWGKRATDA